MNFIYNGESFPGPQANQSPSLIKGPAHTQRESKKMAPGLHQLVIGNWLASWFPIQVDSNQGPRGPRLIFWVAFGGMGAVWDWNSPALLPKKGALTVEAKWRKVRFSEICITCVWDLMWFANETCLFNPKQHPNPQKDILKHEAHHPGPLVCINLNRKPTGQLVPYCKLMETRGPFFWFSFGVAWIFDEGGALFALGSWNRFFFFTKIHDLPSP